MILLYCIEIVNSELNPITNFSVSFTLKKKDTLYITQVKLNIIQRERERERERGKERERGREREREMRTTA
jgi:hypothetical protein